MQKIHRFRLIPWMHKISFGPLPSIDTFYSIQGFWQWTVKAQIRLCECSLIWTFTVCTYGTFSLSVAQFSMYAWKFADWFESDCIWGCVLLRTVCDLDSVQWVCSWLQRVCSGHFLHVRNSCLWYMFAIHVHVSYCNSQSRVCVMFDDCDSVCDSCWWLTSVIHACDSCLFYFFIIIIFITLWANSADDKLIFFLIFPGNRHCHFIQIVSWRDTLHEMSKPGFWENK